MTESRIEHLIEEHRKLEDAENKEFMSHFNLISDLIEPADLSKAGHQRKVNQVNLVERNLKDLVDTNKLARFLVLECRATFHDWHKSSSNTNR